MCESREATSVEIHSQRIVASAECVYPHIELSASEKQRVEDIALAYIVLDCYFFVGAFPSTDIAYFVENEYAFALAFRSLFIEFILAS